MKKLIAMLVPILMLFSSAYSGSSNAALLESAPVPTVEVSTDVASYQSQDVSVVGGGDSDSTSSSSSDVSINSTSISNYRTRTQPITTFPPYLPYWNHGGWGTIKAYFPNGPNSDDQVYERIFNPRNPDDIQGLRSVLESLPYESPLDVVVGFLNGVGAVFGGPDNFHHGRGFEIANSLVRARRPARKPLLVFIDSNVDTNLLSKAGYAYVGKVSLEGRVERNWDHVYDAAVAEALPWDVDILLISGGMKGVTVGSNLAFPGAGGAYSQANYSISLFGAVSSGITEGKGKALVSAAGYRYCPALAQRRRIPEAFYERFHSKFYKRPAQELAEKPALIPAQEPEQIPPQEAEQMPAQAITKPVSVQNAPQSKVSPKEAPAVFPAESRRNIPGVEVSQELYDMAGFEAHQRVDNLTIR